MSSPDYCSRLRLGQGVANVPRFATVHPNLFLACQMPNTRFGEQLFVQFMSTSANKMWLWQKGRFQMGFNGPDAFWTVSHAATSLSRHLSRAHQIPRSSPRRNLRNRPAPQLTTSWLFRRLRCASWRQFS